MANRYKVVLLSPPGAQMPRARWATDNIYEADNTLDALKKALEDFEGEMLRIHEDAPLESARELPWVAYVLSDYGWEEYLIWICTDEPKVCYDVRNFDYVLPHSQGTFKIIRADFSEPCGEEE